MQEELSGLSGWAADVVESLGEVGLGLLVALENVFPPLPTEPVLALAGLLAAQGRLSLTLLLVCSTLGSVAGSLVLYGAGLRIGRERVLRLFARAPLVDEDDYLRAEDWFVRHGSWAVFLGRFVPVIRSGISVPAGVARLPLGQFALLTALGSGAWNTAFVLLGYLAGDRLDPQALGHALDLMFYGGSTVIVVLIGMRWRRNHRRRSVASEPCPPTSSP